jgi:SAM-dependent methyltransferase
VKSKIYDLAYRWWAPWDAVGVRDDLRRIVEDRRATPTTHPRAVDLGCGTGANVVFLAEQGFEATGVDFSAVALGKARSRATDAGMTDRCTFVEGDLTADGVPGLDGPFDLLVDFGTLDDLRGDGRRAMARTVRRLSRAGSVFLLWCFYGARADLPGFSLHGPSRLAPAIEPGEEQDLFGESFAIEPLRRSDGGYPPFACFLMTRR